MQVQSFPNYDSVAYLGSTTITFSSGINYFGFLWTAGDAGNLISFYDTNDTLLAHYNTADLASLLPSNNTATRIGLDGESYYTGNYWGQPNATGPIPTLPPNAQDPLINTVEPYAYLHFITPSANIARSCFPNGTTQLLKAITTRWRPMR